MSITVKHARQDGSFVVLRNGMDYHVTAEDPLHAAVAAAAEGLTLEPEPVPDPLTAADRLLGTLAFMERFTPEERTAIRAAARAPGGEALDDWLDLLRAAQVVHLDEARTVAGMQALVDAGLITAGRRDAILG